MKQLQTLNSLPLTTKKLIISLTILKKNLFILDIYVPEMWTFTTTLTSLTVMQKLERGASIIVTV